MAYLAVKVGAEDLNSGLHTVRQMLLTTNSSSHPGRILSSMYSFLISTMHLDSFGLQHLGSYLKGNVSGPGPDGQNYVL